MDIIEMADPSKAVILMSGGLDSTSLAAYLLKNGWDLHPISFYYGSKHNDAEYSMLMQAGEVLMNKYKWYPVLKRVKIDFLNDLLESDLLQSGGDIPHGHYAAENMKSTVVPGRNAIMLSIAAAYAESLGASYVTYANHAGDHCLPGDELVITQTGKTRIADVNIGDRILSHNLDTREVSFQPITQKIYNGFRSDILEICTLGGRVLQATSNHKFFKVERSNFHQHRGWTKTIKEVKASSLQKGDFILVPATDKDLCESSEESTIDLLQYCDTSHSQLRFDDKYIWFKQQNKVNRFVSSIDFVKLIAWYITEGNIGSGSIIGGNSYRTCISQSAEINPDQVMEISSLLQTWGFNTCSCNDSIYFSGPTTAIFRKCGITSSDKKVPEEFLTLHPEILFETLMKGDGHQKSCNEWVFVTKSSCLREQVCWLGLILGFSVGVNELSTSEVYSIRMQRNFKKKMNAIGEVKLVEIKQVNSLSLSLPVYDIGVHQNHNFFAGAGSGVLVSNSIYPDCRPAFVEAMNRAILNSSDQKVGLYSPFQDLTKADICVVGFDSGAPLDLTWSCYEGQLPSHCGNCSACTERCWAFLKARVVDQTVYRSNPAIHFTLEEIQDLDIPVPEGWLEK